MMSVYMNRDDFLSIDAIRFGLNGLQKEIRFFVVLMVIVAVLYNLPSLIVNYFFKFQVLDDSLSSEVLEILIPLAFASIIIYLTVELGLLGIALKFRDNAAVGFKDLFRGYPLLLNYMAATIIFSLMIMLPFLFLIAASALLNRGTGEAIIYILILLIILGAAAFLHLRYQFFGYFIVDRGSGPIEALKQSARMTKGVMKQLLIFWAEMILGIAFALAMVSIFIEIPVGLILRLISEDLAPLAGGLVDSSIRLFIIVPLTKLATADIYRRLEWRAPRAAAGGPVGCVVGGGRVMV